MVAPPACVAVAEICVERSYVPVTSLTIFGPGVNADPVAMAAKGVHIDTSRSDLIAWTPIRKLKRACMANECIYYRLGTTGSAPWVAWGASSDPKVGVILRYTSITSPTDLREAPDGQAFRAAVNAICLPTDKENVCIPLSSIIRSDLGATKRD